MSKFLKLSLAVASFTAGAVLLASSCASQEQKIENATPPQNKPAVAVAENPSEPIKVTVSTDGYEPKSIAVKKGQPVKLAFFRKDEENCGDEVVFPKLNIKKKLPVGETVTVEFTPEESGEIGFTCGMDMLRGKVLVQ
jgi:plastocyanin domain-containing protein